MVLGLVRLIDAKDIGVAQLIWLWCCPTWAQKQAKNAFYVFLGCFWAYVKQPHSHIDWATPMPFKSINPINPRTNPWNFQKKILRIGWAGKWVFFESAILIFFFQRFFFLPHLNENKQPFDMRYPFFSALWMVSLESWKRGCPNYMHTTLSYRKFDFTDFVQDSLHCNMSIIVFWLPTSKRLLETKKKPEGIDLLINVKILLRLLKYRGRGCLALMK